MTLYLLDVNLLLALTDPMHLHHQVAHHWFLAKGQAGWATCPITENGFIRVASHPKYPNRPGDVQTVTAILRRICTLEGHHFWTEDVSIRNLLKTDILLPQSQITDIFLLGLAVHKAGKLATLDQRIYRNAVEGGSYSLELLTL